MKKFIQSKRPILYALALVLIVVYAFLLPSSFTRGNVTAVADSYYASDLIRIDRYDVDMQVQTDRKVRVKEQITVTFLQGGLTMFYRSLPVETANYSEISASCEDNEAFSYYVADNPDIDGFIDINCTGGVSRGKTWVYELSYTMENGWGGGTKKDGMIVDVIGYGWSVPLHNVSVRVSFPQAVEKYALYVGEYGADGAAEKVSQTLSDDGKTLTLQTELLPRAYNDVYGEYMAEGITLDFTLRESVLAGYTKTRLFTEDIGTLVLIAFIGVALALALFAFTRKKHELVTTVNVKAPDDFDPLKMGKYIDGVVDNEDLTSMIYYFAHKGYLKIDLTDENDPQFISLVNELPQDTPVYQKTLFHGLFKEGREIVTQEVFSELNQTQRVVKVSQLSEKYFETTEKAKKQMPPHPPMYEKKSIFGYICGGVIGVLLAFICCYIMGKKLDSTYRYFASLAFAVPVLLIVVFGYIRENYRYKWKQKTRFWVLVAELAIALVSVLIFVFFFAKHMMTEYEKLIVCACAFAPTFITQGALSRTQKYLDGLGEILGFKDFIVYTEEDKIKFMLEENPELFYKILPYAQVLGVTDEWEGKFKNILLQPPSWYVGGELTVFDYLLLNRCVRLSMVRALAEAAKKSQGGGFVGRSGGGGSFGGFGGGGFGGGGGGAR